VQQDAGAFDRAVEEAAELARALAADINNGARVGQADDERASGHAKAAPLVETAAAGGGSSAGPPPETTKPPSGPTSAPQMADVWEAAVVPTAEWFAAIRLSQTMMVDHDKDTYELALSAVICRHR
jgi:hypothetical protein